jgi:transposase
MSNVAVDFRRERGLALAKSKATRFRHIAGGKYLVPSAQDGGAGYVVDTEAGACTCPDHEERAVRCKHLWAVEFFRQEVTTPDGTTVVTEAVRITYRQDWRAYNAAQCEEKDRVQALLRSLCDGIVEPPQGLGRPRIPLGDAIYSAAMKVYVKLSARRATSDLRACEERGYVGRAPDYSSVCRTMERADLTPVLRMLVQQSALPLRAVETTFALDSTGFATSTWGRWFDEKHGKGSKGVKRWIKLHGIVGTQTNVFTAVSVTENAGPGSGDSPNLPALVEGTAAGGFALREVSADKAYLSHANLATIEATGAAPFIPFKVDSRPTGSPQWERLYCLFRANGPDFLARYHRRSNVESSFSALKRLFGGSLLSRKLDAQFNEVLLKVLCFNLTTLVHSIHELGVEPRFWMPQGAQS